MPTIKSLLDYREEPHIEVMSEDLTRFFLNLSMSSHAEDRVETAEEILNRMEADGSPIPFIVQVFLKRLIVMSPKSQLSFFAMLLMCRLSDNPGTAVMWAYAVHKHPRPMSFNEFVMLYGYGFPTKAAKDECWDGQKGFNLGLKGVDNYIDTREAWT